jgi:hypothetical protein
VKKAREYGMNKLQGFYALRRTNLSTVSWSKYNQDVILDSSFLWTVRTAVMEGEDLNLPRMVGATAKEAMEFARKLSLTLRPEDMIIYYPFFIAKKSGVLDIAKHRVVIEAVKDDLWNLVTYNKTDLTMIFEGENISVKGDESFLSQEELLELTDCCTNVKRQFKREIEEGKSVMLEWSYACKSNLKKQPVGEPSLLFYEIRTV